MTESMLDLNIVCLVCLCPQKEFCSIFNNDPELPEMKIVDKITSCSNMRLSEKLLQKVPHKICSDCLGELSATWRFRKKCEAANKIFQSMHRQDLEAEELAKVTLEEHKLKLPAGLKVKCVNSLQLSLKMPSDVDTHRELSTSPIGVVKLEDDFDPEQTLVISTEPGDIEFVSDCMNLNGIDTAEESVVDQVEYVYSGNYFEDSNNDFKVSMPTSNIARPTRYMDEDEKSQESTILLPVHDKPKPKRKSNQKHEQSNKEPPLEVTRRIHDAVPKTKKFVVLLNQTNTTNTQANKANTRSTTKPTKILNRRSEQQKNPSSRMNEDSDWERPQPTPRSKQSTTRPSKICDVCGNTYKYQHALNAHMRRHNNERPYPCEVCNKAFVSNVELRRHMRMHTGQKPYACKFCDRRFSDFGSSKKHERIHTGERPYVCEVCNKGFAYAHVLTVHRRTHTGEKKFPCPHCEKGFTKKVYLLAHVEQHKLVKRLPYLVKDVDLTNGNSSNGYNDINIGTSILLQGSDGVNADTFTSSVYDDDKVLEECIVTSDDFIGDGTRLDSDSCGTPNDHHVDDVSQAYPVVLSSDFMDTDQLVEHKYIMP